MRSLNRALVVGGAGFIGSWLVESLLDEGIETTVLDRMSGRSGESVPEVDLIVDDVSRTDLSSPPRRPQHRCRVPPCGHSHSPALARAAD